MYIYIRSLLCYLHPLNILLALLMGFIKFLERSIHSHTSFLCPPPTKPFPLGLQNGSKLFLKISTGCEVDEILNLVLTPAVG